MVTGHNPTYISSDGHLPIPLATDNIRRPHTQPAPKRTGLDWDALRAVPDQPLATVTDLPTQRPCKDCRLDTPLEDLADGMCGVCRDIATARFTTPDPGPGYDRTPSPEQQEVVTVATPDFPSYVVDLAVVMRDTEGHPDPAVRAARKAVANAMVGLNKALLAAPVSEAPAAAVTETPAARGKYKRWAPGEVDEMIRRYQAGESTVALGEAFGCSHATVSNKLHAAGITIRPKRGVR